MAENINMVPNTNQKPITNPKLVEAMKKVKKENNIKNQNEMINLAVNTKFLTPAMLVPVSDKPDANGQVKTNVKFNLLTNGQGQKYFMAFTDMETLKGWADSEGKQPVAMSFDDYAAVLMQAQSSGIEGFVINPFTENITFSKQLITNCMAHKNMQVNKDGLGVTRNVIDKNTKVKVGNPGNYPIDMVNSISDELENVKEVNAVYLQLLERQDAGTKSFLFIVDFDDAENTNVYDSIAMIAKSYITDISFEFITTETKFGQQIIEQADVKPFYKKKKFNIFNK